MRRRSVRRFVAMRWKSVSVAIVQLGLCVALRAEPVPVSLGDLNLGPPPASTVSYDGEPYGFQPLGERIVFASVLGAEGRCLLWSFRPSTRAVRLLASADRGDELRPCFTPAGVVNGLALYFFGQGSLWRSDGTPAGTEALSAIPVRFDAFGSDVVTDREGGEHLVVGGCASNGTCGLWRTDGTVAGTAKLHGARGGWIARPQAFVSFRGRVYFIARSGRLASGLWRSDGTEEGTALVHRVDLPEGFGDFLAATPAHLFFASFGARSELWVSDGTPDGTRELRAFPGDSCEDGVCTPSLGEIEPDGQGVLFVAADVEHGEELWRSDGTESGTSRISDLPAGLAPLVREARRLADRWVFPAVARRPGLSDGLWATQGDPATTAPLYGAGCAGECPELVASFPAEAMPEGRFFFAARDEAHGAELWSSDGTVAGTRRLTDACPGPCDAFAGQPSVFLLSGRALLGRLFLALRSAEPADGLFPMEEWSSDGAPEGTERVLRQRALDLFPLDGRLLAGTAGGEPRTLRLWTLDGTASGTRQEATFLPYREESLGSNPVFIPARKGTLFLSRVASKGLLYRSDGTPEGTAPIAGTEEDLDHTFWERFVPCGRFTYLLRQVGRGPNDADLELWRTDGAPGSTQPIHRFQRNEGVELRYSGAWQGRCVFPVQNGTAVALWVSDGTPAGTRRLFRLPPSIPYPTAYLGLGERFLFVSSTPGPEGDRPVLYRSDGTWAGTEKLRVIDGEYGFPPDPPWLRIGPRVYFLIQSWTESDLELWVTDGSPEGTHQVVRKFGRPLEVALFQETIVFAEMGRNDPSCATNLLRWRPGDRAPVQIAALPAAPEGCASRRELADLTPAGERLFFSYADAQGQELWCSDGTPEGTRQVRDIQPGSESSRPNHLTPVGERLYFVAQDPASGREIWTSDGTVEGTYRVLDLNPGLRSSSLDRGHDPLTQFLGRLVFAGDDGVHGVEPWALRVEP